MYNAARCAGGEIMTTKQLRSYRSICVGIADLRADLNKNHKVKIAVSSASDYPYSKHTVTDEGYDLSIPGTKEKLEELEDLKAERREIEDFVYNVSDIKTRKALKLYINGHTNQYIALKLGYCSEGTIRNLIKKIL